MQFKHMIIDFPTFRACVLAESARVQLNNIVNFLIVIT